MERAAAGPQISIFKQGPTCCAVCAPLGVNAESILREVIAHRGDDPHAEWKVLERLPHAPIANPRPCPNTAHRLHWLVIRVAS